MPSNLRLRWAILSWISGRFSPSTNFSGSMPMGKAATVTNFPLKSTPFGVDCVCLLTRLDEYLRPGAGKQGHLQDARAAAQEVAGIVVGVESNQVAVEDPRQ